MELNITGNTNELTLQNKTHVLTSETRKLFSTNRVSSLKNFLSDFGKDSEYSIYYGDKIISVWPLVAGTKDISKNEIAFAVCNLEFTDELNILRSKINVDIREKDFCELLRKMAKYGDLLKIKDDIENMEMKKIVSMSKSKDSRGNYSFEYSVKDHGKASFLPPEKLSFTIPVFKHIEKSIQFDLEFVFSYVMAGADEAKEARLTYRLEMLNLDQFIEKACTVLIEDQMNQFSCKKYWGSLSMETKTDEWMYKDVPMVFEGLPKEEHTHTIEKRY